MLQVNSLLHVFQTEAIYNRCAITVFIHIKAELIYMPGVKYMQGIAAE